MMKEKKKFEDEMEIFCVVLGYMVWHCERCLSGRNDNVCMIYEAFFPPPFVVISIINFLSPCGSSDEAEKEFPEEFSAFSESL